MSTIYCILAVLLKIAVISVIHNKLNWLTTLFGVILFGDTVFGFLVVFWLVVLKDWLPAQSVPVQLKLLMLDHCYVRDNKNELCVCVCIHTCEV